MKYSLFVIALIYNITTFSQSVNGPRWTNSGELYFETAQISHYDDAKKSFKPSTFKTASVSISDANSPMPEIVIDIPDVYYIKGYGKSISYDKSTDGSFKLSYTVDQDNKMASITFMFDLFSSKPERILVVYSDNITKTPIRNKSCVLTELK